MTRSRFAQRRALIVALFAGSATLASAQETALPIPPLAAVDRSGGVARIALQPAPATREILPGVQTPTLGYNGNYLGPTIRVRRGEDVEIRVTNGMKESTTVHWHGMHLPAASDGGPHQLIQPGDEWTARFSVRQQAATLWYHPHPDRRTGEQVYQGLAGLMIIDDEYSDSLNLPSEYGVNDIPLIIQDRSFDADGRFVYVRGRLDVMHGIVGERLLVNGAVEPAVELPRELVRLRVLNASDSNVFLFQLQSGDQPIDLYQIASDGGLLAAPHATDRLILATGERGEVIVDLRAFETGEELSLVAESYQGVRHRALRVRVGSRRAASPELRAAFAPLGAPHAPLDSVERAFVMRTMGPGGQLTINGRRMDMDRIDVRVPRNTTEVWTISNPAMGMMAFPHAFHIHNGQFRILDIDGEPPPPQLAGWKDTFLVWPNQVFRVVVRFDDYLGVYMYHCHFLVHEDAGMMGQFEVVAE